MNIILSDYKLEKVPQDYYFLDANEKSASCRGCFKCWLKTPGKCIIKDKLEDSGSMLMQAKELVIISKCTYGGFSANVKKVLDRSIGGVLPFFTLKINESGNKEQHHAARYDNNMKLRVIFYGAKEGERVLATKIVKANGLNYYASTIDVSFVEEGSDILL